MRSQIIIIMSTTCAGCMHSVVFIAQLVCLHKMTTCSGCSIGYLRLRGIRLYDNEDNFSFKFLRNHHLLNDHCIDLDLFRLDARLDRATTTGKLMRKSLPPALIKKIIIKR